MKAISIHFGVLMTMLSVIYGLWQHYEYDYLIFKTILIFVIWVLGSSILQLILKIIVPKPASEEANEEEPEEVKADEQE